jgi:uncharacterized protein (DUF885 family)
MTDIFQLSSDAVDRIAALDPVAATYLGVPGHEHRWTDLSPAGTAATRALHVELLDAARAAAASGADGELARRVLIDEMERAIDSIDAGDHLWNLNSIASPFQTMRSVFEVMPTATADDWEPVISRLLTIDQPLSGYQATLAEGLTTLPVARRQVDEVIHQARIMAGDGSSLGQLLDAFDEGGHPAALRERLAGAIDVAKSAAGAFADWLATEYMPGAVDSDGVGRERYLSAARQYLGAALDPDAAYAWGWEQIDELWRHLLAVCREIDPDAPVEAVIERLHTDPARAAHGADAFLEAMAERQRVALDLLSGEHFDVPDQARAIDVKAAPEGGSLAAYYGPPSEDFSRPGCVWYPLGGRDEFPLFEEVSTAYHEGFPGHHLQMCVQQSRGEELSRFHRLLVWYPGSGEGWALYAERYMYEQGFMEKPDYVVGWLAGQLLRACRIVVDIGCHLDLPIPGHVEFHPGERWNFDLAKELLVRRALQTEAMAESEVIRYLGWPGQAISYKLGERAILDLRARKVGAEGMSLKDFHRTVLNVGSVGLDLLEQLVAGA